MGKDQKTKHTTGRIRAKNRQQKEKQKYKKPDLKRVSNTRIRRISGKR